MDWKPDIYTIFVGEEGQPAAVRLLKPIAFLNAVGFRIIAKRPSNAFSRL